MKWLLSKLGLLKQHKKTQGLKDDLSFLRPRFRPMPLHVNGFCESKLSSC